MQVTKVFFANYNPLISVLGCTTSKQALSGRMTKTNLLILTKFREKYQKRSILTVLPAFCLGKSHKILNDYEKI
jgi:hypothetical protein